MPTSVRGVVFDFDGTLVDSDRIKQDAFLRVSARLPGGHVAAKELIEEGFRGTRGEFFAELSERLRLPEHVRNSIVEKLTRYFTEMCEDEVSRAPQIKGAETTMDALHKMDIKLFVNSGTPTETLRSIIGKRGWTHWFMRVLGSERDKRVNLQDIMTNAYLVAGDTVVVGNKRDDQECARALGTWFVAVGEDEQWAYDRTMALLPDLASLPGIIRGT
jgi:phosphoglycolate phosphatase-like HAD superfamily hydrolase